MYIYVYIYMIYMIYIYLNRERETERQRGIEREKHRLSLRKFGRKHQNLTRGGIDGLFLTYFDILGARSACY